MTFIKNSFGTSKTLLRPLTVWQCIKKRNVLAAVSLLQSFSLINHHKENLVYSDRLDMVSRSLECLGRKYNVESDDLDRRPQK